MKLGMAEDSLNSLRVDLEKLLEIAPLVSRMEKLERLESISTRLNFVIIYGEGSTNEKQNLLEFFKTVQFSLN